MNFQAQSLAQPLVALLIWTMVMWVWLYATRLPAFGKAKIDAFGLVGTTGTDLDGMLPAKVQWKTHHYNHLLEQPVLFYAVILLLIVLGYDTPWAPRLAWFYVATRVAHSIVQVTFNRVFVRFTLFALGSFALIGLIAIAAVAVF